MLTAYIRAAMKRAHYEMIEDSNPFYGEITELRGVWASGKTLEACREQLEEVVEEWIALGLRFGDEIPVLDGVNVNFRQEEELVETC